MKKLISISLLSAVAILAAPKAAPKAQDNTAPAATTTVKKAHKKHVKKVKTTVTPAAAATPSK